MAETPGAAGGASEKSPVLPAWRPTCLLITCEHGGYTVPPSHRHLFSGGGDTLCSHRGWDPGALKLARRLAGDLAAPLIFSSTCRLLVELNRSEGHPQLFSEFTGALPAAQRDELLARYYHPYRDSVRRTLAGAIAAGERALHLSVHSFTPRLGDEVRSVEVGLLFDPARRSEVAVADWWLPRLRARTLDARPNEPYQGTDDGLTTALRSGLPADRYAGLELEVRSDLLATSGSSALAAEIAADLRRLTGCERAGSGPA